MKGVEEKLKTLWITGASSGLGLAVAEEFAARGWLVIGGARSFDGSQKNAPFIKLPLDVTDPLSCENFVKEALTFSEKVDVLICGAAILMLGSCEMTSVEEYRRVMETNFLGCVSLVSQALPIMRKNRLGKIILFSSINGLLGIPFQSAYTASKHAIEGYAECLAMETKSYGIQAAVIEPGDHRGGSQKTRLHSGSEKQDSPYAEEYRSATQIIARDETNGLYPQKLGKKVYNAVTRKNTPFRIRVAKPEQRLAVLLHGLFPAKLNFSILNDYYHVKK